MSYYAGRIKVVCESLMCFPVHPATLEPLACSIYDHWAWSDRDVDAVETITFIEWLNRRVEQSNITQQESRK